MNKELIISVLENPDISKVVWIEINLEPSGTDKLRVQYYSKSGEFKSVEQIYGNTSWQIEDGGSNG